MSVITRSLGDDHFHVFTKGAPEKIEELCLPHSLPQDFHQQLRILTLKGYRVIGLAHRQLPLGIMIIFNVDISQSSKIRKKCNFKSTKTQWQKNNFCTRNKLETMYQKS